MPPPGLEPLLPKERKVQDSDVAEVKYLLSLDVLSIKELCSKVSLDELNNFAQIIAADRHITKATTAALQLVPEFCKVTKDLSVFNRRVATAKAILSELIIADFSEYEKGELKTILKEMVAKRKS